MKEREIDALTDELVETARKEGKATTIIDDIGITLRHENEENDPEYDDMFSITVVDGNTGEWMLDTGDVYIDDIYACVRESVEYGKDLIYPPD